MRDGYGQVAASYDNILIGTTLSDMTVPEPGSLALVTLAIVGIGVGRRKRA